MNAFNEGKKLYDQGDFSGAMRKQTEVIGTDSSNYEAYNERGLFYRKTGNYNYALSDFYKALETNPNFSLAYVNMGNVYFDMKKFSDAIDAYKKALSIDPTLDVAERNLQRALQAELDNKSFSGRVKGWFLRRLVEVLRR
jgi:tetratricopeptide (TPR) repeat protein